MRLINLTVFYWVCGITLTICGALLSVVWYQLNARIKKVEDWKVDKGFCKTNNSLITEKFSNIHFRITESIETNSKEHAALGDGIHKVDNSVDDIQVMLVKMNECMIKMANNQEC